jgi:Erv1 / Alr family
VDAWNADSAKSFYETWYASIPGMCGCADHWKAIIAKHPPDFTSPAAFFAWTVDRHNDVNARLGKPIMSHEEARALYLTP